jgi:hypothetical protein
VTIIGITGKSFAQPYLLLKVRLSLDPGLFWRTTIARTATEYDCVEEAKFPTLILRKSDD